jgi:hypothetical protein
MKASLEESFDHQREAFGAMANEMLIDKDKSASFLIEYRDSLKESIEAAKKSLE